MVTVSNNSQLLAALRNSANDPNIQLNSGTYSLNLRSGDYHDAVITEVDGADVTFSKVDLRSVSHLTFDGLDFNLPTALKGIVITNSSDITIQNSNISGSTVQGTRAIFVNHTDDFNLVNNNITGFATQLWLSNIDGMVIQGNDMSGISYDGMMVGYVQNVLIAENDVDMATPAGRKHTDAFQFYNNGGNSPLDNVTIRDNYIVTHGSSHGIYLTNNVAEASNDNDDFFHGLVIDNNVLFMANSLGISVGHSDGAQITDNYVLRDPGVRSGGTPIIRVDQDSVNAEITGNTVHKNPASSGVNWYPNRTLNEPTWHVADNRIVPIGTLPPDNAPAMATADVFHFDTNML